MFSQDIGGEKIRPCESTSSPSTANVDNNPDPPPSKLLQPGADEKSAASVSAPATSV